MDGPRGSLPTWYVCAVYGLFLIIALTVWALAIGGGIAIYNLGRRMLGL